MFRSLLLLIAALIHFLENEFHCHSELINSSHHIYAMDSIPNSFTMALPMLWWNQCVNWKVEKLPTMRRLLNSIIAMRPNLQNLAWIRKRRPSNIVSRSHLCGLQEKSRWNGCWLWWSQVSKMWRYENLRSGLWLSQWCLQQQRMCS